MQIWIFIDMTPELPLVLARSDLPQRDPSIFPHAECVVTCFTVLRTSTVGLPRCGPYFD
jgi:hypothetical protein